jgi:hypothetical protein
MAVEVLWAVWVGVWASSATAAAAGTGGPSLQAVGALRPTCQSRHRGSKPLGNRSSGACFLGMGSRKAVQKSCR